MKHFKTTNYLNVRFGPGPEFGVSEVLPKDRVIQSPTTEGWTPVMVIDEDGEKGVYWCSSAFLVETEEAPPAPPVFPEVSGTDFLTLAATKIGQEYVLGANAPFEDPDYDGPWDCAEFVSWVVYQTTKKVYGCVNNKAPLEQVDAYTGGWAADVASGRVKGISLELAYNTPGAILLRYHGKSGHVVFSDGKGGTVEAMGSDYGVVRGKSRGRDWTNGILIPGVKYS